jgi:integrase
MTTGPAPAAPAFDLALAEGSLPVGAVRVTDRPVNQLFDLLDRYCKTIVLAHHQSPMTAITYEWRLGKFFQWLHGKGVATVDAITYALFEDYIADSKWPSSQTAHKFACQMRKFTRWCKARGTLAPTAPDCTGGFKVPKPTREDPKSISREDLVRLLDGAKTYGRSGGRMEVAVGLASLAGLRRSEIVAAKWSDLNVETKRLRVLSPKTHRLRFVAVSPKLLEILTRNRGDRRDDDAILDFPSFGGTTANGNRALHALCKKVGIKPIGWHALRHTAAFLQTDAGVDIEKVRLFLGHHDLTQTSIYVRGKQKDTDMDDAVATIL